MGGGGLSWVKVGAQFSNTPLKIQHLSLHLIRFFFHFFHFFIFTACIFKYLIFIGYQEYLEQEHQVLYYMKNSYFFIFLVIIINIIVAYEKEISQFYYYTVIIVVTFVNIFTRELIVKTPDTIKFTSNFQTFNQSCLVQYLINRFSSLFSIQKKDLKVFNFAHQILKYL